MKIIKPFQCVCIGVLLSLSGCALAPKYKQPTPPVPQAWHTTEADKESQRTAGAPAAAEVKWREFFTDARLQSVIELALANNRDLRMAALNIEKAQALYKIQRAQQYPTVSAAAGGEAYRLPAKMSNDGKADTVGQITVGVGISNWEPDLFGRIRSLKSAALEQYMATEQARRGTQIALVGAVANSYLALAADRENLRLARETLKTQQAYYELILRTRDAGMASDLELRQTQSQVEAARVDIARYAGQVAVDENALNLVVGAPVPANLLPGELGSETALKDVAAGLPSEVLLKRPDILSAEHQLKAAYANIGAARANFFPRISLTAALGLMSGDLTNLFKYGSRTWDFAPQAALPIFDAGARKANLKVAEVDRDLAVAEYEKAIQSAFREVSDSLSLRTRLMEQQDAQQNLVDTLAETYRLSDARYKAGIDSYLSVLVAQRSLYGAQQGLVSLRFARMSNLVTLYKVLGGGA
ncbi:MAG: efflux transporter outer membrane subunit [Acidobacteriales bacterium]|nr:efflux transporter outer membrane subunit [Terriglobales bacterium]